LPFGVIAAKGAISGTNAIDFTSAIGAFAAGIVRAPDRSARFGNFSHDRLASVREAGSILILKDRYIGLSNCRRSNRPRQPCARLSPAESKSEKNLEDFYYRCFLELRGIGHFRVGEKRGLGWSIRRLGLWLTGRRG
jgi:hypothetical protein